MVRTYWFVLGFNEASSNLDLQPFARVDHVEACRPRAWECPVIVRVRGTGLGYRAGAADLKGCARERAQLRRDRPRRRAGRGGLRGTTGRRRDAGGDRRARPGRRRMLLLRLHALEGAAATGGRAGGGEAGPWRAARPRGAGATGGAPPPRRGGPRPRRLGPAALAGRTWDRPLPRQCP